MRLALTATRSTRLALTAICVVLAGIALAARPRLLFERVTLLRNSPGYSFAASVAATDRHIAAGAPGDNSPGAVEVFEGATLAPVGRLTRLQPQTYDGFGQGLAAVGSDFIIGAPGVGEVSRVAVDGTIRWTIIRPGGGEPIPPAWARRVSVGTSPLAANASR